MGKAKMLGQFNPRPTGKNSRKAPWQGQQKKVKITGKSKPIVLFDEIEATKMEGRS